MTYEALRTAMWGPVGSIISMVNQVSGLSWALFLGVLLCLVLAVVSWIRSGR